MSFAEVLAAAKALPRDEQLQLVQELGQTDFPPNIRAFFTRWIQSDQEGQFIEPIRAPEAAAVLEQLLREHVQ